MYIVFTQNQNTWPLVCVLCKNILNLEKIMYCFTMLAYYDNNIVPKLNEYVYEHTKNYLKNYNSKNQN